jgi:hypothetical protein
METTHKTDKTDEEMTRNVADLTAEAKALGIEVDARWGLPRLQREVEAGRAKKVESETPDPDGALNTQGELVNVGSTADPHYERKDMTPK